MDFPCNGTAFILPEFFHVATQLTQLAVSLLQLLTVLLKVGGSLADQLLQLVIRHNQQLVLSGKLTDFGTCGLFGSIIGHQFFNNLQQLSGVPRLGKKTVNAPFIDGRKQYGTVRVGGQNDPPDIGPCGGHFMEKLISRSIRHQVIGNNQLELPLGFQNFNAFCGTGGSINRIGVGTKKPHD